MGKKLHNHTADSYRGLYSIHKYWSKKPHNVIKSLIAKNTKEKEVVLDSFCGSGIALSEALALNRKVIGIDINPASIFITRQLLSQVDLDKLTKEFQQLKKQILKPINSLYRVKRKDKEYIGTHFIWEEGYLTEVWYRNGNRYAEREAAQQSDITIANQYSYGEIEHFYPKDRLISNSRINVSKDDYVYEFYTPRNLKALSMLFDRLNEIDDVDVRETLKFCFTASLGQTSNMVFVNDKKIDKTTGTKVKRDNKTVGSWVIGYWRPRKHFEINVWNCFEQKFNKLLKARQEIQKDSPIELNSFDDLIESKEIGYQLFNLPAQTALTSIPSNSIDYVITDPPHGDRIPYLELSQLWNSWLQNNVNYNDEIIISGSNEREKNSENYNLLLNEVFKEIHRVLKPGKSFTLMFNSLDDDTWINIIECLNSVGFQLKKIETLSYSSNSVVQDNRKSGLKTDFVFTYSKSDQKLKKIHLLNGADGDFLLHKEIKDILRKKDDSATYEVFNQLFFRFLKRGSFFKLSRAIKVIDSVTRELSA